MKPLLALSISLLMSLGTAFADKPYADNGFSFTHPDAMDVVVNGEAIKTLVIKDKKGTQVTLQNFGDKIDKEKLSDLMVSTLLKRFGNDASALTHKKVTRTFFGENHQGTCLLITKNNVPIECAIFTFEVDANTICVITQHALQFSPEAEAYFKTIQNTLQILEAPAPPTDTAPTQPATPAQPRLRQLPTPPSAPAQPGNAVPPSPVPHIDIPPASPPATQ